jgi:hypothetical protein
MLHSVNDISPLSTKCNVSSLDKYEKISKTFRQNLYLYCKKFEYNLKKYIRKY